MKPRYLPEDKSQLNVRMDRALFEAMKERVKGTPNCKMVSFVEAALTMYMERGTYTLYTNEDEKSEAINGILDRLEVIEERLRIKREE